MEHKLKKALCMLIAALMLCSAHALAEETEADYIEYPSPITNALNEIIDQNGMSWAENGTERTLLCLVLIADLSNELGEAFVDPYLMGCYDGVFVDYGTDGIPYYSVYIKGETDMDWLNLSYFPSTGSADYAPVTATKDVIHMVMDANDTPYWDLTEEDMTAVLNELPDMIPNEIPQEIPKPENKKAGAAIEL